MSKREVVGGGGTSSGDTMVRLGDTISETCRT